jgi:hypothetical protein
MKRAARFSTSMVKNIERNKTLVCNECAVKQCTKCNAVMKWKCAKGGATCKKCDTFNCKHCPEIIRAGDIGVATARHSTYEGSSQICGRCETAGKTLADGRAYACVICKERKYRRRFDEKRIQNYNERGGPLHCLECVKVCSRCAVCKLWKENAAQGWTATKLDKSRRAKTPTALVCANCVGDGYGARDQEPYTCIGCRVTQGRYKFDKNDMNNKVKAEKEGKAYILFCEVCRAREGRLLSLVKSPHAWKCKCRHPICSPHCPLCPGRSRGCNLGVRREDLAFLAKRPHNEKWLK